MGLYKLQSEQDTIQPQDAVETILKAIDELMEIKFAEITQEIIQIRLNLDVEVRMSELSGEID